MKMIHRSSWPDGGQFGVVKAPARDSSPATPNCDYATWRPTLHVITRDFKKTPVPMTFPTTIAVVATGPRARTRVGLRRGSESTDYNRLHGLKQKAESRKAESRKQKAESRSRKQKAEGRKAEGRRRVRVFRFLLCIFVIHLS